MTDDYADELSKALVAPIEAMGTLLAKEIDKLRADVNELQQHVTGLQKRVGELEEK